MDLQLRNSTPTTDIYGTKLVRRLPDIYDCIHYGAEEMEEHMSRFPKPSKEGHMEIELLMAAILSRQVEKGIVIQSLLLGDSDFNFVGITGISEMMDEYLNDYRKRFLHEGLQRHSLKDFIKENGNLVLRQLKEPDQYGNIRIPIFKKNEIETVCCRFVCFEKSEQTVDFIRENFDHIIIDKTEDGEYLFRHQRDINWLFEESMKYVAYFIFCSPLNHKYNLTEQERDRELSAIKRQGPGVYILSGQRFVSSDDLGENADISPILNISVEEGAKRLELLAASFGITGKYEKQDESDLPF